MPAKTPKDILDYWFNPSEEGIFSFQKHWFGGGEKTDRYIGQHFSELHRQLTKGFPAHWPKSRDGLTAAIIIIDQFTRNLYRGKAEAFQWDDLAVGWALEGWQGNKFRQAPTAYQVFTLMPLVHSESLKLHDLAIIQFDQLLSSEAEPDGMLTGFYSSALEHRDIIKRFGRYPHRNQVLSRPSTEDEISYLTAGAKRFGQ